MLVTLDNMLYIIFCYRKSAAVLWGGVAVVAGLYGTDWSVIMKRVPFYGGKFKTEEDES